MKRIKFFLLMLILIFSLGGCASFGGEDLADIQVQAAEIVEANAPDVYVFDTEEEAYAAAKEDPVCREVIILRLRNYQQRMVEYYKAGYLSYEDAFARWQAAEVYIEMFKSLRPEEIKT